MVMALSLKERNQDVVNQSIRELQAGRNNAGGTFTCTPSAGSTTVLAPNCSATSVVLVSPLTAHAATELATMWFTPGKGQFVVNHSNSAVADRTFGYATFGGN